MKFNPFKRKSIFKGVRCASTMLDGHSFPSKLERDVAERLLILQRAREISNLRFQHSVQLGPDTKWKIDFSYIEDGRQIFHEAKGFEDGEYRRKKKLYKKYIKEELRISKRRPWSRNHTVVEIINEGGQSRNEVCRKADTINMTDPKERTANGCST